MTGSAKNIYRGEYVFIAWPLYHDFANNVFTCSCRLVYFIQTKTYRNGQRNGETITSHVVRVLAGYGTDRVQVKYHDLLNTAVLQRCDPGLQVYTCSKYLKHN